MYYTYVGKQTVGVCVNILIDCVQLYYTYVGKQTVGVCVNILIECVHVQLFHTNLMSNDAICFICFSKLITEYSYIFHVYKQSECRIWFKILPLWKILDFLTHQFMIYNWLLDSNKYNTKQVFFLIWSFGWKVMR